MSRQNGCAKVTAFEGAGLVIEAESCLLFVRAVTAVAMLPEDRLDVLDEVNGRRGCECGEKGQQENKFGH